MMIHQYSEKAKFSAWAAWLITLLLLITGFQRIKEVVAYVLMKLYEFFVKRNAVKI